MKPLFEEKQRFTQWWLWVVVIVSTLLAGGSLAQLAYKQLVLGIPQGDRPMSNEGVTALSIFTVGSLILLILGMLTAELELIVDRAAITYRYKPFIWRWKRIDRENIESFEVKKYYLRGYGVRWDLLGNRTINVKGNSGIELTFVDRNRKLLLGTQRPDEFFAAVNKMKTGSVD